MRNLFAALVLAILPMGPVVMAHADPLEATNPDPVLPDPRPNAGHDFPHSIANGGVADPSHELGAVTSSAQTGCGALNPCALPTPRQTHVDAPRPARPS